MRRLLLATAGIAVVVSLAACNPKMQEPIAAGSSSPSAEPMPTADPEPTASPSPEPSAVVTTPPAAPKPGCKQGPHQLEVEQALSKLGGFGNISADGTQSDDDCAAIKKFQKRFGLKPDDGVAGPATRGVANRLLASDPAKCGAGSELTACIDLTNQTTYLMRDGKVIYGPTVTRTGYDHPDGLGAPTPTGSYKITQRLQKNWTESFKTYLYYWQRIMGNNGFHATTSYIHDMAAGSHGCVNLLQADAIAYWEKLSVGTTVKVFGRRPGT